VIKKREFIAQNGVNIMMENPQLTTIAVSLIISAVCSLSSLIISVMALVTSLKAFREVIKKQ